MHRGAQGLRGAPVGKQCSKTITYRVACLNKVISTKNKIWTILLKKWITFSFSSSLHFFIWKNFIQKNYTKEIYIIIIHTCMYKLS